MIDDKIHILVLVGLVNENHLGWNVLYLEVIKGSGIISGVHWGVLISMWILARRNLNRRLFGDWILLMLRGVDCRFDWLIGITFICLVFSVIIYSEESAFSVSFMSRSWSVVDSYFRLKLGNILIKFLAFLILLNDFFCFLMLESFFFFAYFVSFGVYLAYFWYWKYLSEFSSVNLDYHSV
jgi:hypothetical protein